MSKCVICMKVKGKRKCSAFTGVVCSACCGSSRDELKCAGCTFYKSSREMRRYDKASAFSSLQMLNDQELQRISNTIEGALCGFDAAQHQSLTDGFYKNVLERLLDRYCFGDHTLLFADELEKEGVAFLESAITEDLPDVAPGLLGKVLGAVYRSLKRHADERYEGRAYMDFILHYIGIRMASGVRVVAMPEQRGGR